MQRNAKGILLALIAVFAMSAVTAAAASATKPEFYPLRLKQKVTATSGTSYWNAEQGGITCAKSTTSGEVTGATTVGDVIVKYNGCWVKTNNGQECAMKSTGAGNSEEIVTHTLKGELGLILPKPASGSDVGLLLTAEKSWFTLQSKCALESAVSGSLAGLVEPIGKKVEKGSLDFDVSLKGGQDITEMKLDSGTTVKPELVSAAAPVLIEQNDATKFEEELEVT